MKISVNKNGVIKLTKVIDSIEIDPECGKRIALHTRHGNIEFGIIEIKEGLDTVNRWYSIEKNHFGIIK